MALHQASAWNRRIRFSTNSLESAEHARKQPNGVLNVMLRRMEKCAFVSKQGTTLHLQVLKGHQELLVQPSTSTTPGAPSLCHDCSLTRLHLQLGIQLHVQPLRLHSYLTTVSKTFEYRYGLNYIKR
jgi:hypothetical protein